MQGLRQARISAGIDQYIFVTFVSELAKSTQLLPRAPAYSRSSQAKSDPSTPTL